MGSGSRMDTGGRMEEELWQELGGQGPGDGGPRSPLMFLLPVKQLSPREGTWAQKPCFQSIIQADKGPPVHPNLKYPGTKGPGWSHVFTLSTGEAVQVVFHFS